MADRSDRDQPVPLGDRQLQLGVYIWIDRPWTEHSFLRSRFKISSEKQLRELRALGPRGIYWIPALSDVEPIPPIAADPPVAPPPTAAEIEAAQEAQAAVDAARERARKVAENRERATRARRDWERAGQVLRDGLRALRDNPKQGGAALSGFADKVASQIDGGQGLLHLVDQEGSESLHAHALSCMTLATLVGRELKVPRSALRDISTGALIHDIGKLSIPGHILRSANRTPTEENVYRDHCRSGLEIARESGAFSELALSVIRDHHEHLDGSGFPAQASGDKIGLAARIVAVVNRYDRLCGPESPTRQGIRPADALRKMWRDERSRLDERVIAALVRVLGVYPPGTIVELSDGRYGLAVNPSAKPLRPKLIVYEPSQPKDEADLLDLSEEPAELSVSRSLAPDDVAPSVLAWLNPRERLAYYFTADEE